ncbi:MAG: hypothetical protein JWN04_1750 [Myxococcaceae bacterium]|nr:hypothetical protein [Myxococcaceae bacterium]
MKIERLELKAFGPFTDKVLDFSQRPGALQLVYGPNEAGKSSTLRALIGLLYGIDSRTQDAHLHDTTRLRIGATVLDELGRSMQVLRRKGLKNTLMDQSEKPIGEGALTPLLGGLDESLFRQMFGLDHERLRQGAEALLRGGGQLGEVLFDASTGGRGVHTLIESLRAEAESLYKARGRNAELNVALESVRQKKKLRNEAALRPEAYAEQLTKLAEARVERDRALELRRALGAEKSRLTRLLQLVPVVAKRDAAVAELAKLTELARQTEANAEERRNGQASGALLDEAVQELNRRYGSVLANEREEPTQRAALTALAREVEELRARLGHELSGLSGLDSATRARIRKRADDERKLTAERAELARAEAGAAQEAERLEARLAQLPALEALESGRVSAWLHELAREDLSGLLTRNLGELDKLRSLLARREKQLGLELELEQLTSSTLPSDAAVAELERAFDESERERERLTRERALTLEQHARLSAQRGELLARGELATRTQLEHARSERDAAFDALFADAPAEPLAASPSAVLVRAHAAATQRADALADRMVREAQEAAELLRVDLALGQLMQQQRELEAALAQLAEVVRQQRERWTALSSPLGLAAHGPRAARPLLVELRVLCEQASERAALELKQAELEARADARSEQLLALLGEGASLPDSSTATSATTRLERACARAKELCALALERTRERAALAAQLEKIASERAVRRGRANVIASDLSVSKERYLAELSSLGLTASQLAVTLAPDELLACFDELSLLAQRTREHAALQGRLESAQTARQALHADVRALAARCLPPAEQQGLAVDQALAALSQLQRARSDAERDQARHRGELEKLEEQLLALSDGVALSELRLRLGALDPHAARARLEEIDALLEEQSERSADLEQSIGRLSGGLEKLEESSGAAELAEDYEQELSHARALTRRYVEVRLSLSLLGGQVERYRNAHQQPVLKRASELFPRLTLQRYRGLTVEFNDQDEPVLSCVTAGGHTVPVTALSDGTRDQLYLALRVASIERYFEGRPPLPLILDDALIHFDDARATAALEVLGELSKHTQVLFFTHHKRMVELAHAALGEHGVQLHELAGRAAPRSDGPLFDDSTYPW